MTVPNPSHAEIEAILRATRTVVVLGASVTPWKAGHYVPEYLHEFGIRILPVNPTIAGRTLFGERVRGRLGEITPDDAPDGIDLVDVFRRPELLAAHVPELLALRPKPGVVWFQEGIRNDAVARQLLDAGLGVVQDRCTLADHRALAIPPVR